MLCDLKSKEYYGGLNRRFNRRAALLRRFGFRYEGLRCVGSDGRERSMGVAVLVRERLGRVQAVAASTLTHADKRAWLELLGRTLTRGVNGWKWHRC